MSGSKYFVYSDCWRELDVSSGLVAGWARRVSFLYVRRGRLRVAKRRRVLASLQAFASNRPSAIRHSSRLSVYSKDTLKKRQPSVPRTPSIQHTPNVQPAPCVQPAPYYQPANCMHTNLCVQPAHCVHQCCTHFQRCNGNFMIQQPQCEVTPRHDTADVSTKNITKSPTKVLSDIPSNKKNSPGSPFVTLLKEHAVSNTAVSNTRTGFNTENVTKELFPKDKAVEEANKSVSKNKEEEENKKKDSDSDDERSDNLCKELTISESDVWALRSYVAKTRPNALSRFDADNEYKLALFYAINPLVYVERCKKTERAIRERLPMALAPFAARLGLSPSPNPGVKSTPQSSRSLRAQVRRERLENNVATKQTKHTHNSDSEDEDFEISSRSKRFLRNKPTVQTRISNKKEKKYKNQHRTVSNSVNGKTNNKETNKNKNVNIQKKSEQGSYSQSNTDSSDDLDGSDSESSGVKENVNKSISEQTKNKPHDSNSDTSESDEKSTKDTPSSRSRMIEKKRYIQDSDSDSDNVTDKENKSYTLKHKRVRHDSNKSETGRNNHYPLRKKAKTRQGTNTQMNYDSDESLNNHSGVKESVHARRSPRTQVRERNQLDRSKVDDEKYIDDDSDSENDLHAKKDKKAIDTVNKNIKISNENIQEDVTNHNNMRDKKSKESAINKIENVSNERTKRASFRKESESSNAVSDNTSNSDDESIRKRRSLRKRTDKTAIAQDSDSDSVKENINRRNSLRSVTFRRTKDKENNTDYLTESDESFKNKPCPLSKKGTRKLNIQDSDSDSTREKNNRSQTIEQKRKRKDSDTDVLNNTDENRRNSLRKKAKLQEKSAVHTYNGDNHVRDLEHSVKAQAKSRQVSEQLLKQNKSSVKSNKILSKKVNEVESNQENSSDDAKNFTSKNILRKRNQTENSTKPVSARNKIEESKNSPKKVHTDKIEGAYSGKDKSESDVFRESKSKTVKPKMTKQTEAHVISKRSALNEYSNLEDHAIVAWVSNGDRARKVNGNRLWKELLEQYRGLTGIDRSWHSLRNRYLRYILPSLGSLGLPPHHVSRLRAAAATGELKSKRKSDNRRNSIFEVKTVRTAYKPSRPAPTAASTPNAGTSQHHSPHKKTTKHDSTGTQNKKLESERRRSKRASTSRHTGDAHSKNTPSGVRRSVRTVGNLSGGPTAPDASAITGVSTHTNSKTRKLFNPKVVHDVRTPV